MRLTNKKSLLPETQPSKSCLPLRDTSSESPSSNSVKGGVCDVRLPENSKRVKRARTMPSVSIYRPPAARKLEQSANLSNMQGREMVSCSSPEKNRKSSEEAKELIQGGRRTENNGMSVFRNAITSIRTQSKVPKCKNVESTNKKNEPVVNISKSEDTVKNAVHNRQRRPDIQVYVPKGRRSATGSNNVNSSTKLSSNGEEKSERNLEPEVTVAEEATCECVRLESPLTKEAEVVVENPEPTTAHNVSQTEVTSNGSEKLPEPVVESKVPEPVSNVTKSVSDSKLINSKQADVVSVNNSAISSSNSNRNSCEKISENRNTSRKVSEVHLNPDECDWESMFDDTGECLDPSLLEQLTNAVGEVTIEKPKSTYEDFKTKSLDMVADEFPHVIEIYNFPPEFQLQDLMTVFSQFKNSGFEIKWVDDTHALGIFSSSAIVAEVLAFHHPFVKTRSLKEGTPLSKMKARRSAEFLQPYKPRPDTCPALARRLVTGALGVRLPTSREEREAEKKILTKAREKKRLEAKQKEDAWEGLFS